MLAKLDMKQEGVLREFARQGNGFEDAVLLSVLRREWEGREKQKLEKQKAEMDKRDYETAGLRTTGRQDLRVTLKR